MLNFDAINNTGKLQHIYFYRNENVPKNMYNSYFKQLYV